MEMFHHFLNKVQTITSNDWDTMGVFAEAGMAEVYAWNGDSIN